MTQYALQAANMLAKDNIDAQIVNVRFVKPIDTEMLDSVESKFDRIITIEENAIPGGFGSAVTEYFADNNYKSEILRLGLPDKFIDHGTQVELHALLGIDAEGIVKRAKQFVGEHNSKNEVII